MDDDKVSSGPTTIIVILLIMLIFISGYIVYDRVYRDDNGVDNINTNTYTNTN